MKDISYTFMTKKGKRKCLDKSVSFLCDFLLFLLAHLLGSSYHFRVSVSCSMFLIPGHSQAKKKKLLFSPATEIRLKTYYWEKNYLNVFQSLLHLLSMQKWCLNCFFAKSSPPKIYAKMVPKLCFAKSSPPKIDTVILSRFVTDSRTGMMIIRTRTKESLAKEKKNAYKAIHGS